MTGRDLLNMALAEGVEVKENHDDLAKEFDKAINENRVYLFPDDMGFITYELRPKGLLINKCVIRKQYRSRFNFLPLRNYFRSFCKQIYWKSRKHNRLCWVR